MANYEEQAKERARQRQEKFDVGGDTSVWDDDDMMDDDEVSSSDESSTPTGGINTGVNTAQPVEPQQQAAQGDWYDRAINKGFEVSKKGIFAFAAVSKEVAPYFKPTIKSKLGRLKFYQTLAIFSIANLFGLFLVNLISGGSAVKLFRLHAILGILPVGAWFVGTVFNLVEKVFGDGEELTAPVAPVTENEEDDDYGDDDDINNIGMEDYTDDNDNEDEKVVTPVQTAPMTLAGMFGDDDDMDEQEGISASSDGSNISVEDLEKQGKDLSEIGADLISRDLLLDKFLSQLQTDGKDFSYRRSLDVDEPIISRLIGAVGESQEALNHNENELVTFKSAEERLQIYELVFYKEGLSLTKAKALGEDLQKSLRKRHKEVFGSNVQVKVDVVSTEMILTVFKKSAAIVYLKDLIENKKDFMRNGVLPTVLGVNERGEVLVHDFGKDVASIITGAPRTGKSNLSKVLVSQLVCLNSPDQVQFVIGDVKGGTSDWTHFTVPHVRRFESSVEGILSTLRWLANEEKPRRRKLLESVGAIKIEDYNIIVDEEQRLPFLFFLMDEMLSFGTQADKDQLKEFRDLLGQLVSEAGNVGLKFLLVPHRVVDSVIPKTVSVITGSKISVMGKQEELAGLFSSKEIKEFDYVLANQGDFAMSAFGNEELMFGHAPILMTNDVMVMKLLSAQRKMWEKMYPEIAATSAYARKQNMQNSKDNMNSFQNGNSYASASAESSRKQLSVDDM